MLKCPHCNQQAMTQFRKSYLGPAVSTSCKSCGKKISVSWFAVLAAVPFPLGMALAAWTAPSLLAIPIFLAGLAAMFVLHAKCVPLVKRGA